MLEPVAMNETPPRPRTLPLSLLPLAVLFFSLMWAGAVLQPPPVRTANAEAEFNAVGARERLVRILGDETPHPIDSGANDAVRERLLTEIRALGYAPEVREEFACRPQPRAPLIDCATVRNIIFSAGPEQGPAILAATHYDSVPAAPGASDAGIGMASWLEIARLLRNEQLQRRVIFLISDGEEQALLGANAFAENDPLMRDVEALVNLEARGTRGPAMFFETNQPNADAVHAFAAAPRGVANSVMADVYRIMPNSTDVSVLTRPGLDVINIALLEGLENYHTPQDSLSSFSTASLQHMGDAALVATRAFASGPDRGENQALVYTDVASRMFVSAPSGAGQAALALGLVVSLFAFWRSGATGRWRAFAAPLTALVLAAVLAFAATFVLGLLRPGEQYWFAHPAPTRAWVALIALFVVIASLMLWRAPRDPAQLGAAGMAWFALIGLAASFALPGISILFAGPVLVFAIGCIVSFVWRPAQIVGAVLAALLAALLWTPLLSLVELALGYAYPFATALLTALLTLTWLTLLVVAQRESPWRGALVVLGAGALAMLITAGVMPSASAARPAPVNVTYFADTGAGEARVLAGSARRALPRALREAAEFAPQLLLPGDRVETWTAPAALVPVPMAQLEEVALTEADGARSFRARLRTNGVYRTTLRIPLSAAPVRAGFNGITRAFADAGEATDYVALACQGRSCDGALIEIVLGADGELGEWLLIGQTPGVLPKEAVRVQAARPDSATAIQFGDGTLSVGRVVAP